jgi:hypothetical protein
MSTMNKNAEMLNNIETPIFSKRKKVKKNVSLSGPGGVQNSVAGSIENTSSIWSEPKKVQFM